VEVCKDTESYAVDFNRGVNKA